MNHGNGCCHDIRCDEKTIFQWSEQLLALFSRLPDRVRNRRANSHLARRCREYQDYITSGGLLSDADARGCAEGVLQIYRAYAGLNSLVAAAVDWLDAVGRHSVHKELEDLFSGSVLTYRTADHSIFTASLLQCAAGCAVEFIPEVQGRQTPDLDLGGRGYCECKDLQADRVGVLEASIIAKLSEADGQLAAARGIRVVAFGVASLDLPPAIDIWKNPQAAIAAYAGLTRAMNGAVATDAVLLSQARFVVTDGKATFPHAWALVSRRKRPIPAVCDFFKPVLKGGYLYLAGGGVRRRPWQ